MAAAEGTGIWTSPVGGYHRARALQAKSEAATLTYLALAAGILAALFILVAGCVYFLLCRSSRGRERGRSTGIFRSRSRAAAPTVTSDEHMAKAALGACRSICDTEAWARKSSKTGHDTVYVVDTEDRRSCSSVNTESDMPDLVPVTPRWNSWIADCDDLERIGNFPTRNVSGLLGLDDDDEERAADGSYTASGGSFSSDCLGSCWTPSALRGALRSVAVTEECDAQMSPEQAATYTAQQTASWCGDPCTFSNETTADASGSYGALNDALEDDERTLPPDWPSASHSLSAGRSSASGSSSELRSGSRSEANDPAQAQVWPWSPPMESSLPPLPSLPGLVNGWHEEDGCIQPTLNRPQTAEPD
eukprot:CAMPEP_0172669974 /NCGR_PEP_ID=MMETSP1074-20121228/10016_1 /TAXON_ID=2916 /ORGANISM="Ceratium fusus, Strain PA161109" /LENGTH=361 /DNA_ID=CAMNT_0013486823 /DNA_START=87 /DNA_END=1172 /DNA_ORIENTATION=-